MYKYSITPNILKLIKSIYAVSARLQNRHPSKVVLFELEKEANSLSSFSSTSIEGNPLPLTEVRKILKNRPKNIRDTEREVLQYNDTLIWLNSLIKDKSFNLTSKMIIQIHNKLMSGLLPKIKLGQFRKEAVLVNDPKSRRPIFWPPDYSDVVPMMTQLFDFVKNEKDNLDPLIIAGIFHKQFVLIHPFIDGNGRTVRLATKTLLAELGLNTFSLFSFENYYHQNVSKYFQKVGERGNFYDFSKKTDFTPWLEYFCEGVLDELLRVEKKLVAVNADTPEKALNSNQEKIISYLSENEFIRDRDYAKITERAKATRALDFKKLVQFGHIEKHGQGPATYYKLKKS